MKITFISGHLCKERHALLNELALDLGKYGAKVTVVTGFPSRRISDDVRKYYLNHPVEQISENVVIKRVGSRGGEGNNLFDRMIKYLFLTWAIYREAKNIPTDAYYLYSSPPFIGWIGILLAKKKPTLYNAQDLFPDTLIKIKGYREINPLIKFLRLMERKVYKNNTKIVTISNEMKETIKSQNCSADKVEVIYNWADTKSIFHVSRENNKLMDELCIDKQKFIISYAGDIGLFQGWPVILDSIKLIGNVNTDIHFVIIGSGSYKEKMEERIKKEKIDNVSVFPLQPASRLSEVYSIGDLELVSIEPGLSRMALPSKTFIIMAAGSPLISLVDQSSDIAKIIKEKQLGYTLEHGDSHALVDTILKAYANRANLSQMGKNARDFSLSEANRGTQTKKYFDVLKSIII